MRMYFKLWACVRVTVLFSCFCLCLVPGRVAQVESACAHSRDHASLCGVWETRAHTWARPFFVCVVCSHKERNGTLQSRHYYSSAVERNLFDVVKPLRDDVFFFLSAMYIDLYKLCERLENFFKKCVKFTHLLFIDLRMPLTLDDHSCIRLTWVQVLNQKGHLVFWTD